MLTLMNRKNVSSSDTLVPGIVAMMRQLALIMMRQGFQRQSSWMEIGPQSRGRVQKLLPYQLRLSLPSRLDKKEAC